MRVVVIVGGAGSGKSALAKRYLLAQPPGSSFAFAAEEFRAAHIDQTLAAAQVPLQWKLCHALIPKTRLFLVEGLERILEGDLREAFLDLLRAVAQDDDSILLVTCRDYHVEVVERSLLRPSGVPYARVTVPELDDYELEAFQQAAPQLAPLLSKPALRALMRNPFLLARAGSLNTEGASKLPETEQGLRSLLWHRAVCNELAQRDNLPARRAKALIQIALDRARAFQPFVKPPDDAVAIQALALDGILIQEPTRRFAAPAHDVWEDWALIMWLHEQHADAAGDVSQLAQSVGTYPALRRAYRKWLLELVELQPGAARAHVTAVLGSEAHKTLKDDTLIGVFQSSKAGDFLNHLTPELLAQDARLLTELLFLVRVACKAVSPLAAGAKEGLTMNWLVPAGAAWANLLEFMDVHWEELPTAQRPLILAFVEDWASGISVLTPSPDGARHAGSLVARLYPSLSSGYGDNTERARAVAIALNIPAWCQALVEQLAERAIAHSGPRRQDEAVWEFMRAFLKPYKAGALCRDFPALAARLLASAWFVQERDLDNSDHNFYSGLREVPSAFGLVDDFDVRLFPNSALQGPFLQFLNFRPIEGLRFITEVINRACAYYGEQRNPLQYVEPPIQVPIYVEQEVARLIWCNDRLWRAFRGSSVAPDVVTCGLMALEKWCLELADRDRGAEYLRPGLEWILDTTNNAALVAVIASVCMAHPNRFESCALRILSCRELIELDRARQVADYTPLAVGGFSAQDQFLQRERIASNKLPHRRKNLEDLARDLQFTESRERVWALIDKFRADLPPAPDQEEEHRLWRLALDRMDIRRWEVKEQTSGGLVIGMQAIDADVQATINAADAARRPSQDAMRLYIWGRKAFDRKFDPGEPPDAWRERLGQVRRILDVNEVDSLDLWRDSLGLILAFSVRDHWENMDAEERAWSKACVVDAMYPPSVDEQSVQDVALSRPEGLAACARGIARMSTREPEDEDLHAAMFFAVMHPNRLIVDNMLEGCAETVGLSVHVVPMLLNILFAHSAAQRAEATVDGRLGAISVAGAQRAAEAVAQQATEIWMAEPPDLQVIEAEDWLGRLLVHRLCLLLQHLPDHPAARQFYGRVVQILAGWWAGRRDRSGDSGRIEIEHKAMHSLAAFLMQLEASEATQLATPLQDSIDLNPDKISGLLTALLLEFLRHKDKGPTFWSLWSSITQRLLQVGWTAHLDDRYSHGQGLVRQAFFNIGWSGEERRWELLRHHFEDVDALFAALPASTLVLKAYAHYLNSIGQDSLPNAYVLIVRKMGDGLPMALRTDPDIRWTLDALVARTLFEQLAHVRGKQDQREAMMAVLDALVAAGSAAAFQLRDDFVTPQGTALA